MKLHFVVNSSRLRIDDTIQGESTEEIWQKARALVESKVAFVERQVMRRMTDQAVWQKMVERYNERHSTCEPVPTSTKEFIDFAVRAGYLARIE